MPRMHGDTMIHVSELDYIVPVDYPLAELPMNELYPHRILAMDDGEWVPVGRGDTVIFGRLCMEHDILATNVRLSGPVRVGDMLVFCDAGAYDRSMSYVFGRG